MFQLGFYEPDRDLAATYYDYNGLYTDHDLSIVYGHGVCGPARMYEPVYYQENYGPTANDCVSLFHALTDSQRNVTAVLKQSFQPPSALRNAVELTEAFEIKRIVHGLTHPTSGLALGERNNARILHCADSVDNGLCDSVKLVFSSDGPAIGFNAVDQSNILVENVDHDMYYKEFLRENIMMSVSGVILPLYS